VRVALNLNLAPRYLPDVLIHCESSGMRKDDGLNQKVPFDHEVAASLIGRN
jgi:hypothetical protein